MNQQRQGKERVSTHSRPKAAGETSRRIGCAPKFQHTAARRRLGRKLTQCDPGRKFQHTAARRRLVIKRLLFFSFLMVSTHSRPKAAGFSKAAIHGYVVVSTHSRPKAAGLKQFCLTFLSRSFNTQPPEGGWNYFSNGTAVVYRFNTQPPEGGWRDLKGRVKEICSFNTQPPEGGWSYPQAADPIFTAVSTHSRPKAAGSFWQKPSSG